MADDQFQGRQPFLGVELGEGRRGGPDQAFHLAGAQIAVEVHHMIVTFILQPVRNLTDGLPDREHLIDVRVMGQNGSQLLLRNPVDLGA